MLNSIYPNNTDDMVNKLNTIGHNNRWTKFTDLNADILSLMRKEINY